MTENKKESKMACCSKPPWKDFIHGSKKQEILRTIRQESIDFYGCDMDRCPKAKMCLTKNCMGRPLPWKSKTAKPYLELMAEYSTVVENEATGERELVIQTNCKECSYFSKCKKPCNQISDFLERDFSQDTIKEYNLIYKDNIEQLLMEGTTLEPANFKVSDEDLAWDCLSEKKQEVIKKYLYEERDYRAVAEKLGILNQAYCKVIFYYSITRLAKFSIVRMFYKENKHKLSEKQQKAIELVYFANKTYKEAAKELGITTQAVHVTLSKIFKTHNVKWPKFVTTSKNKPRFNVFKIFK